MLKTFILLAIVFLSAPTVAHEAQNHETLDISDVWARKTGKRTASAAVYFTVQNQMHQQEILTSVSTDRARVAMIHRSFEDNNVMSMVMQDDVPIAPGEKLKFAPGGYHIMLVNLTAPLQEGDVFPLTLSFKNVGDVTVYVEVTGINGPQTK